MARNGNGTYTPPPSSWNPAINGNAATAPDWNTLLQDIANALTQSLATDGQTPMSGNLNLGGNRLVNIGQPVDDDDVLRKTQIIKGADLPSAANLGVPTEGAMFDVTGTTTIETLSNVFPGRVVILRFADSLTIEDSENLITHTGSDIKTQAGDLVTMVNTESGVWEILGYQRTGNDVDIWAAQPIGSPIPIYTHLGVDLAPPTDSPLYRYIKLTYDDDYNDGVLIDESTTGSAPNVTATGKISLEGSKLNGVTVNLINTERSFLRPGSSGTNQGSANLSHNHSLTIHDGGTHSHAVHVNGEGGGGSASPSSQGTDGTAPQDIDGAARPAGLHTHSSTMGSSGGTESRPRNRGVDYFMRIL